jgi:hypothetical protein
MPVSQQGSGVARNVTVDAWLRFVPAWLRLTSIANEGGPFAVAFARRLAFVRLDEIAKIPYFAGDFGL